MMKRGYQYNFSDFHQTKLFDVPGREKKAITMVSVIKDFFGTEDLKHLTLLDVGSSTGIIDNYLSSFFGSVTGIDIDEIAVKFARDTYTGPHLTFMQADAMNLTFPNEYFDVVICSQVYEHVPDAEILMHEILRILKRGGICFFAAGNRFILIEQHYHLPLLSVLPRFIAHPYFWLAGKGIYYHEKHLSYWGLRALVKNFILHDYTKKMILEPQRFGIEYLINPNSFSQKAAIAISKYAYWLYPSYIWLLQKPQ